MLLIAGTLLPAVTRPGPALALQAGGTALVGLSGALCLLGERTLGAGFTSGVEPALGIDPLSGAFVAIVAVVAVPSALYAAAYLDGAPRAGALAALTGLFQIVLLGVLCARDVTTFLACWELMTLVPAAAILVARDTATGRRAVFEYLAITHIGGAGVWVALIVLAAHGAIGDPAGLAGAGTAVVAIVARSANVSIT